MYKILPSRFGIIALCCCTLSVFIGCNMMNRLTGLSQYELAPEDKKPSDTHTSDKRIFRIPPYLFIADFDIDRNQPLFKNLAGLRERVYRELSLPDTEKVIKVYLFENRKNYRRYMEKKYDNLPERRAFFVAEKRRPYSKEELLVYTYWSNQIEQDLRHELTHALLHSILKDVPLWLDEGLAEYFETPEEWKGIHHPHLEKLRLGATNPITPNMERLEKMTKVEEMQTAEYREAWAWVHFMLRGDPRARQVLLGYLRDLRHTERPGSLYERLRKATPNPPTALIAHLRGLELNRTWSSASR